MPMTSYSTEVNTITSDSSPASGKAPKGKIPAVNVASGKILVTGGAGYIGSHTCKAIAEAGFEPLVIDDLSSGKREFVKWGELIVGDIADQELTQAIFSQHKIRAVINFASLINVGESVKKPILFYKRNIVPTLNLLEVMRDFKVNKMIFSSSCAVYGAPHNLPISEEESREPLNPYGKTKWIIENLMQDMAMAEELSGISLRYFNASGADSSAEIGEAHDPETHLIPLVIRAAFDPEYTLQLFGDKYGTKDGSCVRDYVHVTDLAQAHVLALKKVLTPDYTGVEFFNVGSGKGYSNLEVIKAVERISGRPVKYVLRGARPGDPAVLLANCKKITEQLNWNPIFSDIDNIVKTALQWYKKNNY